VVSSARDVADAFGASGELCLSLLFFADSETPSVPTRETVERLPLRGVGLFVDKVPDWAAMESRMRSNLRFFVSRAYMIGFKIRRAWPKSIEQIFCVEKD
jgi:hypothetical protein